MREEQILLSKYNQFPRHELKIMGLIPVIDTRCFLESEKVMGGKS